MSLEKLLYPIVLRRDVKNALESFFLHYLKPDMTLYDIGCGEKPFAAFLKGRVARHIGVDIADGFYDPSVIDLVGSAYDVPAGDGSADAVLLSQVIEHLETPRIALKEAHRLLKPGGLLFLSYPFLYPVHAAPRDFFRYTDYGCENMLKEAGIEVIDKKAVGGFWYCIGFFIKIYLQAADRGILKKTYAIKVLTAFIQWLCLGIHAIEGLVLSAIGKNADDYRSTWPVNYIVVGRKV